VCIAAVCRQFSTSPDDEPARFAQDLRAVFGVLLRDPRVQLVFGEKKERRYLFDAERCVWAVTK
jgi:hypothetical protein